MRLNQNESKILVGKLTTELCLPNISQDISAALKDVNANNSSNSNKFFLPKLKKQLRRAVFSCPRTRIE